MIRLLLAAWFVAFASAQPPNLLERADEAFRNGDFEQAGVLARQVLARNPGAVHAHMIAGVVAARKNQWQASDRHFLAVLRLDPSNPHGYFYLGQARLYQRQWVAAIGYFTKALERKYPDTERLLIELALAQTEAGRPADALRKLGAIAQPADERLAAQYHAVTAFARAALNEPGLAVEAIRRSLQLDDSIPHSWEFLIGTLIRIDEAPLALAEAIRAQRKFPDHPEIQYLFALASYHVNESPLSGVALRNLREADPESPRVLLAEGLLQRKQGKNEEALSAFRRAAERGAQDSHLLLGIVYRENGDYDAAGREYREAERLNPANSQVALELGKLFLIQGQLTEAKTRLEKAAKQMPDSPSVHYQLGLLYRRLNQPEESEYHFRRSKDLNARVR